jgi:hypothetical protein
MVITREAIISALHEQLTLDPRVLAAWLEGADATQSVDEYSVIDFCCSVEAGSMAAVKVNSITELGEKSREARVLFDETADWLNAII